MLRVAVFSDVRRRSGSGLPPTSSMAFLPSGGKSCLEDVWAEGDYF